MSGSVIKLLAIILMTVDHVGAYLLQDQPACTQPVFTFLGLDITVLSLMRGVGRMAFPLFAWLLVEGFIHTRNRFRYGLYLFLFALLSEIPFDLARTGQTDLTYQNVFFTLWLSYMALCVMQGWVADRFNKGIALLVIWVAVGVLRSDYGFSGFFFTMVMYYMHHCKVPKILVGSYILPNSLLILPAGIPMYLYNGQRGFIKGTAFKLFFYLYYPLHLLVIHILQSKL